MITFTLNKKLVEYYADNPYSGCYNPHQAALGRAAEFTITNMSQKYLGVHIVDTNNLTLLQKDELKNHSILCKGTPHDGIIFLNNKCVGINESKLIVSENVYLSKVEVNILNYCIQEDLMYIVSLGRLIDSQNLQCEYLGYLNLIDHLQDLNPIKVKESLKFNSERIAVYASV